MENVLDSTHCKSVTGIASPTGVASAGIGLLQLESKTEVTELTVNKCEDQINPTRDVMMPTPILDATEDGPVDTNVINEHCLFSSEEGKKLEIDLGVSESVPLQNVNSGVNLIETNEFSEMCTFCKQYSGIGVSVSKSPEAEACVDGSIQNMSHVFPYIPSLSGDTSVKLESSCFAEPSNAYDSGFTHLRGDQRTEWESESKVTEAQLSIVDPHFVSCQHGQMQTDATHVQSTSDRTIAEIPDEFNLKSTSEETTDSSTVLSAVSIDASICHNVKISGRLKPYAVESSTYLPTGEEVKVDVLNFNVSTKTFENIHKVSLEDYIKEESESVNADTTKMRALHMKNLGRSLQDIKYPPGQIDIIIDGVVKGNAFVTYANEGLDEFDLRFNDIIARYGNLNAVTSYRFLLLCIPILTFISDDGLHYLDTHQQELAFKSQIEKFCRKLCCLEEIQTENSNAMFFWKSTSSSDELKQNIKDFFQPDTGAKGAIHAKIVFSGHGNVQRLSDGSQRAMVEFSASPPMYVDDMLTFIRETQTECRNHKYEFLPANVEVIMAQCYGHEHRQTSSANCQVGPFTITPLSNTDIKKTQATYDPNNVTDQTHVQLMDPAFINVIRYDFDYVNHHRRRSLQATPNAEPTVSDSNYFTESVRSVNDVQWEENMDCS